MIRSSNFDDDLIRTLLSWNEGPRLDYKCQMFFDGKKPTDTEQFEFIKDIIAFANISRREKKPCWIVFGVQDDPREVTGLQGGIGTLSEDRKTHIIDDVESKRYCEFISQWITPTPQITIEYGYYDGKFISYLEIQALNAKNYFRLAKQFNNFQVGKPFIRYGSSSIAVHESQEPLLEQLWDCAYISQADWKRYFNFLMGGEFHKAKLYETYIMPKVKGGSILLNKQIEDLLRLGKKKIYIKAPAGCGKSTFLRRFVFDLVAMNDERLISEQPYYAFTHEYRGPKDQVTNLQALEVIPRIKIPIFISLRRYIENIVDLDKIVAGNIGEAFEMEIVNTSHLFSIPGSKWVIFLDGIDELWEHTRVLPILEEWLKRLPNNVQVVLTGRPYIPAPGNDVEIVEIEPPSQQQKLQLILRKMQTISPSEFAENEKTVKMILKKKRSLYHLLSNFRAIDGFVEYIIGKSNEFRESLDFTLPTLSNDRSQGPASSGEQAVPSQESSNHESGSIHLTSQFDENDFLSDTTFLNLENGQMSNSVDEDNDQDSEEDNSDTSLIALLIDAVIKKMYDAEVQRQMLLKYKPQLFAEAQYRFEEIAWESNWAERNIRVNIENWEYLQWFVYLGYLENRRTTNYEFTSKIIQLFPAAIYILDQSDETARKKVKKKIRKITKVNQTVINYINQLRRANGLETISI